jgi:hypothetical protein
VDLHNTKHRLKKRDEMIKYENIRIHLTPVAPSEQIIVCD